MPKQKKKVGPKARVKIAEPIGEPVVVAFGEEGVAGIFPELAEVRLAGGWLRIIVLAATFGAILGPAVAAMSWARVDGRYRRGFLRSGHGHRPDNRLENIRSA